MATARILIDGWLHTGDLGYDDGFFFVVNWKDDLSIRGGYNVYQVPSRRRGVRHRRRRLPPVRPRSRGPRRGGRHHLTMDADRLAPAPEAIGAAVWRMAGRRGRPGTSDGVWPPAASADRPDGSSGFLS